MHVSGSHPFTWDSVSVLQQGRVLGREREVSWKLCSLLFMHTHAHNKHKAITEN